MTIILNEKPPNYEEIKKHFPFNERDTIFCYGDKIYNPAGIQIAQAFIEHEETHMRQQRDIGGPEIWWNRYFVEPDFRLTQELEAYGRQYWFFCTKNHDRNDRVRYLWQLSSIMRSPMYKVGNISHNDVVRAITRWAITHEK